MHIALKLYLACQLVPNFVHYNVLLAYGVNCLAYNLQAVKTNFVATADVFCLPLSRLQVL